MPSSPLRRLQAPTGCSSLGFTICFLMDRFSPRPPSSRSTPSSVPRRACWSEGLPAGILLISPTVRALARLRTTFFMVAVTSVLRSSQHLERLRHPSWLVVSDVGLRELLATSPKCWATIEQLSLSRSLHDSSLDVRWYTSTSLPYGCTPDVCQGCVSSCPFSTLLLACDVAYPLSPPPFPGGVRGLSGAGS